MIAPDKENTLYLPIKQVYFDELSALAWQIGHSAGGFSPS